MKTALFPGSFNPFTIGHAEIVRLGLNIFDLIVICFSVNPAKSIKNQKENVERVKQHYSSLISENRIEVIESSELTADIAKRYNAHILRGIRDNKDFDYEKQLASVNSFLGVQTVFVMPDSKYNAISSSIVRELKKYNVDVSNFIV